MRRSHVRGSALASVFAGYQGATPSKSSASSSTSPRRRNAQPERALQTHVFNMLSWMENAKMLRCVWFPVPNGTDVGPKMGAMLKGQGKIRAGVSDLIFMWGGVPEGSTPTPYITTCGAIELKRPGGGTQSEDQKKFERWCAAHRIPYRVARSLDEVVAILVEWGRLPKNAIEKIRGISA